MTKKLDNAVEETQEPEFVWPKHLTHEIVENEQPWLLEDEEILGWIERKITKPGQYFRKNFVGKNASLLMEKYIQRLRAEGLDIGKGETLYGYKMPLTQNKNERDLIIFRRRE